MTYLLRTDITMGLQLLIFRHGGPYYQMKCSDTYGPLADALGIDEHDRRLTCAEYYESYGSESAFENIVRWARQDLIDDGLLERFTSRGMWRLTPRGIELARLLEKVRQELKVPLGQLIESHKKKALDPDRVGG